MTVLFHLLKIIMIVRPQQHWIRLIFVWHGSVLSKIFSRLLLNFLLSIAVIIMLPWYTMLGIKFTLAPFSILGVAIAIFLGFRNNACYARYVEARHLWGQLMIASRSILREVKTTLPDERGIEDFVRLQIAFAHCLRMTLRRQPQTQVLSNYLDQEALQKVVASHSPANRILLLMGEWLAIRRRSGKLSDILFHSLNNRLNDMSSVLAGCERIANTPVPFAYTLILHRTVYLFCIMMAGAANAAEIYNKDGNKLDLYGKVDGLHYFSSNHSTDGDQSYIRMGIKGETQITDQLTGFGQWEYQVNANRPEDGDSSGSPQSWTRLGFAGLAFADMGSVDYGRNYGVLYDIGSWTDVLPEFGNDSYEASDNFMTGRANGVLTYRNNDFFGLVDGLNIALQYQGKNDGLSKEGDPLSNNARKSIAYQNGDGFGASATYDLGMGVSLGAAYTSSKRTLDQMTQDKYDNGDRAEAWTGGVKYDANNIYLAANYTRTYDMTYMGDTLGGFAHKTDNWEMVGQYQFDNGLRPSLAFLQSRANDVDGLGSFDLVKYIDVGSYYYFNKNMSAYVDYKINLLKDGNPSNPNTDNTVALGLVYEF